MRIGGLAVDLHTSIEAVLPLWQDFEKDAAGTFYQSSLWCRAWVETVGASAGVAVRILAAHDSQGRVQFLLPLQIRRRQGAAVLEFLSAPQNGYGFGLYAPSFLADSGAWFEQHGRAVLGLAGDFDAILLNDMPDRLMGAAHPLSPLFNIRGANPSFTLALTPDFEAIHRQKRDSENRRTARKKEELLARLGDVSFGLPTGTASLHATLDQMFQQQQERLAEHGIHGVFGPQERQFLHRLADLQDESQPVLAPYRFTCGDDVLAIMLGGIFGGGYWALISSLAAGPSRKYSPGDLALRRTIAACCHSGLQFIDFSAGDSPYKRAWADKTIDLHVLLEAVTIKGLGWSVLMAARLWLKRQIKSSPTLMPVLAEIRRAAFGSRPLRR